MKARALAARLGATIVERADGMSPCRYTIAECHERRKRIVLYRDTLAVLEMLVVERRLPFEAAQLPEIAIAHECFHLLNARGSEADAHAFVQDFLGLRASPAILGELLPAYVASREP